MIDRMEDQLEKCDKCGNYSIKSSTIHPFEKSLSQRDAIEIRIYDAVNSAYTVSYIRRATWEQLEEQIVAMKLKVMKKSLDNHIAIREAEQNDSE
jgi:hypothetical protein